MHNPYEILGLTPSASPEELKAMYQKLARKYLDEAQADDAALARVADHRLRELNEAYAQISNPVRSAEPPIDTAVPPVAPSPPSPQVAPVPPPHAVPPTAGKFVLAAAAGIADPTARPALWNPSAAFWWSLLFTPLFGAHLHRRNAQALGRTDEANLNKGWFWGTVALPFVLAALSLIFPTPVKTGSSGIWIVFTVAWYLSAAKKQIDHVRAQFQENYERKSWVTPLSTGFGILIAIFLVALASAVIEEFARE